MTILTCSRRALLSGRIFNHSRFRVEVLQAWQMPRCHRANDGLRPPHTHLGGETAIASTSNTAPGRASCGTPIVVLAGGAAVFTYLSRTSR
jgi:hypothetical protein